MAIRSFIWTLLSDSPAANTTFNYRRLKLRLTYFSLLFFTEKIEFFHPQYKTKIVKQHYIKEHDPYVSVKTCHAFRVEDGKRTKQWCEKIKLSTWSSLRFAIFR